ncbi:YopX family protein (plasmid) [Clostridium perfringens]
MSREFKFRVWEPLNKNMYFLNFALYENKGHVNNWVLPLNHQCCSDKNYTIMNLNNVEIMQYTGLKDVNGKEVYEGDIIPFHLDSNVKGVVKFGEYTDWNCKRPTQHIGFYVDFTGEHKRINRKDLGYWVEVSYVIGNIYENPELLEGEK